MSNTETQRDKLRRIAEAAAGSYTETQKHAVDAEAIDYLVASYPASELHRLEQPVERGKGL